MRTIVAGNWKMHNDRAQALVLLNALAGEAELSKDGVEVVVAPPFPFLEFAVHNLGDTRIQVAAQHCHEAEQGAFTGEVSAAMLRSVDVRWCIVGHSERRQYFGETDAGVAARTAALLKHGITPIVCVGENKEQRMAGAHFDTVTEQMKGALGRLANEELMKVVVAYEPVWAIGTGLNATAEQAQDMHAHIRSLLHTHGGSVAATVPILYGGSCKPDNAAELFAGPDVNGGLIGGASLDPGSFARIVGIAQRIKHAA